MRYTATYSPEDNKLRLYASSRLDAETYQRIRAAGFQWAPKQELFYAPAWSPAREDLLIELAGEIEDEDSDMMGRAEDRAERFETYSRKRLAEASAAKKAVAAIADNIPFGQPILVGHHSEKRARKDAERIENGMRKACQLWRTSEYWTYRASRAIAHAKYKELPRVRARRIKTLEAERRKVERNRTKAETFLKLWQKVQTMTGDEQMRNALALANHDWSFNAPGWSELSDGKATAEAVAAQRIGAHGGYLPYADRWLAHYDNRLAYERAMLEEQGASDLLKPKPKPKQLPLLNYRAEGGQLEAASRYERGRMTIYEQVDMTKAEYAKIGSDYKGTLIIGNSHRIRSAIVRKPGENYGSLRAIFITDSATHKPLPAQEAAPRPAPPMPAPRPQQPKAEAPEAAEFKAMADTLKAGIKIVAAPQLFPTPQAIGERMIAAAAIAPGQRILEPSAGTGALLKLLPNIRPAGALVAIEINTGLAQQLEPWADHVIAGDFLEQSPETLGRFDRILMNPPFGNASDITHIRHALQFLAPGGRLVALCADGPRQQRDLRPSWEAAGGTWEALPEGSFASQGTGVRVAMLTLDEPPAPRSELTPQGEQLVIPGCEKNIAPAMKQLELWG